MPDKRTRKPGWSAAAPKTKKARQTLANNCGRARCFLKPDTLGFPICEPDTCAQSCRALRAAKSRAAQYKHADVLKKATKLAAKKKC